MWHDVIVVAPGPSGMASSIVVDGKVIAGVIDWKVEVGTDGPIIVTVSFRANSVNMPVPPVTAPPTP